MEGQDKKPGMREKLKIKGELDIWLTNIVTGQVAERRHIENTVVDAGEIWVAELLAGEDSSGTALSYGAGELGHGLQYIQVGTDETATTQGMFKMQATAMTSGNNYTSISTESVATNVITVSGKFVEADGNAVLNEAGLFSNSGDPSSSTDTSCRMFNRTTFPDITKTTFFQLTLQWTITIGSVA